VYAGGREPRFIFGSLGNFVFDMGFFEALRSYLIVVDVDAAAGGYRVSRVRLVPVRLDGYVPRLLAGDGLTDMARHLAHLSTAEASPAEGCSDAGLWRARSPSRSAGLGRRLWTRRCAAPS
jgi:hypothetical protein